jgi:N-acetylglucosaminyldiphosphoundecaprenol N-acetyl-beta-D-mannosaminyltransferase
MIYNGTISELIPLIQARLTQPGPAHLVTLNPEIWVMADRVPIIRTAIDTAEWVTADGIGISIAQRLMGQPVSPRVTGVDLTTALLQLPQIRVFLLGSTQDVIDDASQHIRRRFPTAKVVGGHHGFFPFEGIEPIARDIQLSRPDLVLVGMGSPRQDEVLDLLAGRVRRAPIWMQRWGLEWVWRLVLQPHRVGRFVRMLPAFIQKIMRG